MRISRASVEKYFYPKSYRTALPSASTSRSTKFSYMRLPACVASVFCGLLRLSRFLARRGMTTARPERVREINLWDGIPCGVRLSSGCREVRVSVKKTYLAGSTRLRQHLWLTGCGTPFHSGTRAHVTGSTSVHGYYYPSLSPQQLARLYRVPPLLGGLTANLSFSMLKSLRLLPTRVLPITGILMLILLDLHVSDEEREAGGIEDTNLGHFGGW